MTQQVPSPGPLAGLRVVEFAGIGPGPFCGMLLADMGADVLRIDRMDGAEVGTPVDTAFDVLGRGKRSVGMDLKNPAHVRMAQDLVARADALIEGFRPGVMEKLGLGPPGCLAANPRLVYGRMTGWGQEGPLARAAAHDINYIAISGALHGIGHAGEPPMPPLTLAGDFGGGGMFLALGMVSALLRAQRTGEGDVVDAAICDGAALLMAPFFARFAAGQWRDAREANLLDGGAPWYACYETADGKHLAIGAIELRFYDELLRRMGLEPATMPDRRDRANWPHLRAIFTVEFRKRTRQEWCDLLEGSDACFAPVLSLAEAPQHPHFTARGAFDTSAGYPQPVPAPRFARSPPAAPGKPPEPGSGGAQALAAWGLAARDIESMAAAGVLLQPTTQGDKP